MKCPSCECQPRGKRVVDVAFTGATPAKLGTGRRFHDATGWAWTNDPFLLEISGPDGVIAQFPGHYVVMVRYSYE